MANTHSNITKYTEYPIIFAFIALICIFVFNGNENFGIIIIVNIVSLIGILTSAISVVRHADVLAHRLGEPYGSLVLTMCIVVLEVCLISILMFSEETALTLLRDTLYSIIMIVLCGLVGISLLLGGAKHSTQFVNLEGINQYVISIIVLSVIVLILPMTLENHTFSVFQMIFVGIFCIILYSVFLIVQTKTHQEFFIHEDNDTFSSHEGHSNSKNKWHIMWLLIYLVFVISITKLNASSLNIMLDTFNAPVALSGFIVACLTLSPEGFGAIKAILNKQVQRGMNLLFGSVIATISLTVPIISVIALITGKELIFGLSLSNVVLLVCILMLSQTSFSTGKTNKLTGIAHLVLFFAYLMIMFG